MDARHSHIQSLRHAFGPSALYIFIMRWRQPKIALTWLFPLLFLSLLASLSAAQLPTLTGDPATNNALPGTEQPTAAATSGGTQQTDSSQPTGDSTNSQNSGSGSATTGKGESSGSTPTNTKISITNTGSVVTSISAPPSITGTGTATDIGGLPSGLPKIPGQYSYPPPSVPPTAGAPYLQHSNLPEGTVFIAVGAALGILGFSVLAWRGLVAWSLHRSVRKAAMQQNLSDSKAMLRPPGGGAFYASGPGSTLSLDHLAGGVRSSTNLATKGPTPNSSLFFSPTAGGGSTLGVPGYRGSGYLPAGYYAAGQQGPGTGGVTHIGGGMSNAGYTSARARSMEPSPPGSPGLSPSRDPYGGRAMPSSHSASSLNLNAPQHGRAPSAYLEDLFENHPPSQGGRAGGGQRY